MLYLVMQGISPILENGAIESIDPGSKHSFVSLICFKLLLKPKIMNFSNICTGRCYGDHKCGYNQMICFVNWRSRLLAPSLYSNVDLILDMDWFSAYLLNWIVITG